MRRIFFTLMFGALLASADAYAQPISVTAMTEESGFYSATLSNDGSTVALVRHTPTRDDLVLYDWRGGENRTALTTYAQVDERIRWVRWKSDQRLVAGVSVLIRRSVAGRTGTRIDRGEEYEFDVTRVVALNRDGGDRRVLFEGQQRNLAARISPTYLENVLPSDPDRVVISAYGQQGLSLWDGNVNTGRVREVSTGSWDTIGWVTDRTGAATLRIDSLHRDEGQTYFRRSGDRWEQAFEVRGGAELQLPDYEILARGPEAGKLWVAARSNNRERTALHLYDTATGDFGPVVYEHPRADISYVMTDPVSNQLLAVCANVERVECHYPDAAMGRHLRAISQYFNNSAEVHVIDVSGDKNVWLLSVEGPTTAPAYYIYDRANTNVVLVAAQTNITEAQLSPTETFTYQTRDNTQLWGYLTTPRGASTGAPLIVMPHGGPETRDYYGFDSLVQFFASRGYVVFQPQFRGSGGFGRTFQEAGRRQWGQRMQDDVTDGVQALIASGRVDAQRICVVGGSYGGYVALAGAAFTPDLYRCAVSINGVSDLPQSLRMERTQEGRRSYVFDYWQRSMGDLSADREMLDRYSPAQHAQNVQIPILLIHGEEDTNVPIAQSEIMNRELRAANRNVRFVRIPDSGHGFYGWEAEHQQTLFTELDTFLRTNLPTR